MFARAILRKPRLIVALIGLSISCLGGHAMAQSGHILDGVGPVDQSMGGATTALPLDAIGSIHGNTASIAALPCSEIGFGFAIFAPATDLSSEAFGMSGKSSSDTDIAPMPSMGFVHRSDDSRWVYGLGAFAVGGFGVDFPDSTTNPINTNMLFGGIYSSFQMLQISTPLAYQLNDRWSVGFSPNFNWASLAVTPFPAATPDKIPGVVPDTDVYPNGARADGKWGLGFQLGVYYEDPCSGWHLGFSYQSTQWLQEFSINSVSPTHEPRQLNFDMDYPAMASLGVAYTGLDRWAFSSDLRYIDYANTDGFQDAGFDQTGAVTGFGWDSIWVAAVGVQYSVCEHLQLRMGYTYNESPIDGDTIFYNVASPAIVQHHINTGFTWDTPDGWVFSFAYHHGFQNEVSGPMQTPDPRFPNGVPGTSVTADLLTHTMVGSVAKRF